jgi:glycosyltransferase involved in cell wall biosynthesis
MPENISSNFNDRIQLAIIVPAYNEGEMLVITIPRLINLLNDLIENDYCTKDSYIVFIDDGSTDNTWDIISKGVNLYPSQVIGLCLACNVGHQGALLAGYEYVSNKCDAAVSLDADLQDDPQAIPRMIIELRNGAHIVLGVRNSRDVDSWFKRKSAQMFYKFMRFMGVDIVNDHADFRLLSASVLKNLLRFSETNLFLRGLQPLLHKKIAIVEYQRFERKAGLTKYPLNKMMSLAWNGITSFSVVPLRLISFFGVFIFSISILLAFYSVIAVYAGKTVPGWASIVVPLYILGGMLMLSIGIVGEYVGKVFLEAKRRPRNLIDVIIGDPQVKTHKQNL